MRALRRALAPTLAVAAIAIAIAVAPLPAAETGAELELTTRVKPLRAEIGDRVEVDLEVIVPAGLAIGSPLFPSWGETWGDAELIAAGEPVAEPASGGATRFRQTVTVTPWAIGELTLPSPVVEVPTAQEILKVSAARPILLTVESVLPEGEEQPPPKPPAPPLPLPVTDAFWWTLAAAAAACLAAGTLVALRRRAAAAAAARPDEVDPLTALRLALAGLEASGDPLALIAGLSLALRRYLGGRLGFRATESTTTEIRRRLHGSELPAGLVVGIDRLLKHCDAVKFARRPIGRDACAGLLAQAAGLAGALEEHLAPPPENDAETAREAA